MNSENVRTELSINEQELKKAVLIYRAVNNKLRQQMLKLIHEREKMTVTEIYSALLLVQSETSQHLAILRKAGLVKTQREKKNVYYSVNHDRLEQIHKLSAQLLK